MNQNAIAIYSVLLSDGDWYWVFATSENQAIRIVNTNHYELTRHEFKKTYSPHVSKIPANQKLLVACDDRGQHNWTARRWAKGEKPGLFCSNTYGVT